MLFITVGSMLIINCKLFVVTSVSNNRIGRIDVVKATRTSLPVANSESLTIFVGSTLFINNEPCIVTSINSNFITVRGVLSVGVDFASGEDQTAVYVTFGAPTGEDVSVPVDAGPIEPVSELPVVPVVPVVDRFRRIRLK